MVSRDHTHIVAYLRAATTHTLLHKYMCKTDGLKIEIDEIVLTSPTTLCIVETQMRGSIHMHHLDQSLSLVMDTVR